MFLQELNIDECTNNVMLDVLNILEYTKRYHLHRPRFLSATLTTISSDADKGRSC